MGYAKKLILADTLGAYLHNIDKAFPMGVDSHTVWAWFLAVGGGGGGFRYTIYLSVNKNEGDYHKIHYRS